MKVCLCVSSFSNPATQRHMLDCKCGTSMHSSENTLCNYQWSNCTNNKLRNELVFPTGVSSPTIFKAEGKTGVNITVWPRMVSYILKIGTVDLSLCTSWRQMGDWKCYATHDTTKWRWEVSFRNRSLYSKGKRLLYLLNSWLDARRIVWKCWRNEVLVSVRNWPTIPRLCSPRSSSDIYCV
jgi:hypothetical protein